MKALFTVLFAFIFSTAFAQETEYRASLNSGLFHLAGSSEESNSSLYLGWGASNPYGSKNGLCYGLSLNVKRVERKNFIYGVDAGVELLLNNIFVNVNPFAGYRFAVKNIDCDLAGGFDIGYNAFTIETVKATASNGTVYTTSGSRRTMELDLRPRIQLDANYNRFGGYLGYSFGLKNYSRYLRYGGVNECYARLFRFGLTYRLN